MSRVEENNSVLGTSIEAHNEAYKMFLEDPDCFNKLTCTNACLEQFILLFSDISKSLAVIADNMEIKDV